MTLKKLIETTDADLAGERDYVCKSARHAASTCRDLERELNRIVDGERNGGEFARGLLHTLQHAMDGLARAELSHMREEGYAQGLRHARTVREGGD